MRRIGLAAVLVAVLVATAVRAQSLDVPGQMVTWLMSGNTIIGAQSGTPPYFVVGWNQTAKQSPYLCDLDGDGIVDRVWWNESLGLTVPWLMNANGTIRYPVVLLPQLEPEWKVVGCADANGDGKADIAWIYIPD